MICKIKSIIDPGSLGRLITYPRRNPNGGKTFWDRYGIFDKHGIFIDRCDTITEGLDILSNLNYS